MPVPLLADPRVPPLEPHYRTPIEPRHRRDINKSVLALLVDARLVLRARLEGRLERARAAVARRLLDRRAWEDAGYSNPRDYAREELGLSLRSLQDLARLDRALATLPRFDAAISLGRLAPSRVLQVLPVVTPESEALWLREAQRNTCARLAEIVRVAREQGLPASGVGMSSDSAGAEPADEPEVTLRLRQPIRSRMLWEGFVEEASRVAGRPLTDGQALELLLAEFRPLLPPEVVASVGGREQMLALPQIEEDDDGEWCIAVDGSSAGRDDGPSGAGSIDPARFVLADGGVAGRPHTQFQLIRRGGEWRRALRARLEADPERPAFLSDLDRRAAEEAVRLLWHDDGAGSEATASGEPDGGDPASRGAWRRGRLHDLDWPQADLDELTTSELQRRFLDLRARLRQLAIEQGALLYLMRNFQLYRALRCAGFGHYTRDRLGLGRRTADQRADRHRAFTWEEDLRRAWTEDEFSGSYLPGFQRLIRNGIGRKMLRPWVERARRVTADTFLDQVRWLEACRHGWANDSRCVDPVTGEIKRRHDPKLPPTYREWCQVRAEWNRRSDLLVWLAFGWQISARGGIESPTGTPKETLTDPLAPSPTEPATVTRRVRAPESVIRSFLDTVEVIRALHGPALPAWWCLEYMMLHVRRDWARESAWAARRTEGYEILERDGFRCTSPGCRSRANLQVHHIRFRSHGGGDDPTNLTTLCAGCHQFAVHQAGTLEVRGRAPHRLVWKMGRHEPRTYVGEFRRG